MTNYTKSCIYKIACKDPNIEDIYIGSTTNFIKRRCDHKSCCNNPNAGGYNQYVYRFIRDHGGWQNWNIYIIEQFSCTTKIAKEQVERGYIEELKPTLNKNVPANYQNGDVWDMKVYQKGYKEQNKDIMVENSKVYYNQNKETIRQKQKAYAQKRINCPCCNHMINLSNRIQHNKTNKHITNSEASSEPDTVMDEMNKLHDDNVLKLQEIHYTCDKINKIIH